MMATISTKTKNQLIWKYGQPQLTESGEELVYWSEAPTDFMATYSKEEMCQLIDGTVADAKELGIETEPPG